ncbi:MAG TPA: hypothetical protein VN859_08845 [Steroidobacteraceae bacterium]|nr:hypothetical protein [Steroidobacteraceae bacterium]
MDENQITPVAPVGATARWDSGLLAPVTAINHALLELLCAPAPVRRTALTQLCCGLDPEARSRLARCPYVLLDAGFGAPEHWPSSGRAPGAVRESGPAGGYFSSRQGIALVRRTLVFAWHLARANPFSARILFGMATPCAPCVAASRLEDLEELAELCPAWVAPRWEAQPQVWRQLVHAARAGHVSQLRQAQLRGLQLLAAS